jgi:hypothetical protein
MGNNESGIARDVANLAKIIELVTQCGNLYNPANNLLAIPALTTLKSQCENDYISWKTAINAQTLSTNQKEEAFATFYKTVRNVKDSIKTFNISKENIKDINALIKKIVGNTKLTKADAGKVTAPESENTSNEQAEEEARTYSSSRRSYDNLISSFDSLTMMLQSTPAYIPNEGNIQVATLQTLSTTLKTCNQNSDTTSTTLLMAMSQRNISFYATDTGLIDVVKKIKAYIRQVYGPKSKQFAHIRALQFTKPPSTKRKKKKKTLTVPTE